MVPLLWKAWPLTGPLTLLLVLGAVLQLATGLPVLLALGTAAVTVGGVIVARGNLSARRQRTAAGVQSWRESRGHMRERYDVAPTALDHGTLGEFVLGPIVWPPAAGERAVWRPDGVDGVHLYMTGPTGKGKSEGMTSIILQAVAQGRRVVILDGKGGVEFGFLDDLDPDAVAGTWEVHQDANHMQRALRELCEDMEVRYAAFHGARVPKADTTGVVRAVRPKNLAEWIAYAPPGQAPEFGMVLVVADELDSITRHPDHGADNMRYVERLAARARGCGMSLLLSTQAVYVDVMSGFVKGNVGARVLYGAPGQVQEDMALGEPARTYLADSGAPVERPDGRCACTGVNGSATPIIVQSHLVDVAQVSPTWQEWEARDRGADGGDSVDHEEAVAGGGPGGSGTGRPRLSLLPGGAGPDTPGSQPRGSSSGDRGGASGSAADGLTPGGGGPATARPQPLPSPVAVAPGSSPGSRRHAPRRGLALAAVRLLVVAPARRLWLRWHAWRLVCGPRLRGGEIVRDPGVRRRERARTEGVCECCYRGPRPERRDGGWQAEHKRPKSCGGTDDPGNIWTLCTECHAIKTAAEARARRWRDRHFGLATLERTPGYVWGGAVAAAGGLYHATLGGPYQLIALAASGLVLWGFFKTMPRDKVDGIDNLVERAEGLQPGVLGDYATSRARLIRRWHAARLSAAVVAASYLVVRAVLWVAPVALHAAL